MKLLIANVGSSSLKCQLFEMPSEKVLAKAYVERVGSEIASVRWIDRGGKCEVETMALPDVTSAIRAVLEKLTDKNTGTLQSVSQIDAVGFKPVCAKGFTGCQYMEEDVLAAMAELSEYICPMHNELCIAAVRSFRKVLPRTPMMGLFETFFFQDWPEYARIYAIPWDWTEKYNVRRYMGHGASHYYVNNRIAEILKKNTKDFNVVQLHLGGSSSVVAIKSGKTVDGTAGFTMQCGVPMSVRSSDMDGFLIPYLWSRGEGTPKQIVDRMMNEGGLAGISGIGFDMRDLCEAAKIGHQRARLAIDTYVYQVKKYLGSMMLVLGHTDVVTVAAGTGEASPYIRQQIFAGLEEFGIRIDADRNVRCIKTESMISTSDSKIAVWVVPTNEEIVVARECVKLLNRK